MNPNSLANVPTAVSPAPIAGALNVLNSTIQGLTEEIRTLSDKIAPALRNNPPATAAVKPGTPERGAESTITFEIVRTTQDVGALRVIVRDLLDRLEV